MSVTMVRNRTELSERDRISELRIRNNKMRRKREMQKNFLLTILTACFAITLAFSVNGIFSNAKDMDEPVYYKYYSSIVVERGDTLWSLAEEHMGDQYETKQDYVKEVMQMNGMSDDKLIAGQYLVIPYYSTQFIH